MGFQHHQNHPFFAQLGWEEHGSRAPELKLAGFLLQAFGPSSHVMQVPRHGPGVAGTVLAPPSPKDEFARHGGTMPTWLFGLLQIRQLVHGVEKKNF
jgi:hypothetical protein